MTDLVPVETVRDYVAAGYWGTETIADVVARHATERPNGAAIISEHETMTWAEYDARSDLLADAFAAGTEPGGRVAVLLPDGPSVHVAYLATEKAGVVAVGIGVRAGVHEIAHLLRTTGATTLVTHATHRDEPSDRLVDAVAGNGVALQRHIVVAPPPHGGHEFVVRKLEAGAHSRAEPAVRRQLGPNDLWLLNSTSGTTGLPKCVTQFQNRWFFFHQLAVRAGELTEDDVFMSAVPAPFGFGLWTAHFTPAHLGAPVAVLERFMPEAMVDLIARERVTVLACVSTQFIMLLDRIADREADLASLRIMFTGGESVPEAKAAEFEDRTGAKVLQFYGSNETGALSNTSTADDREHRLTTAGCVIPEMQVRLLDPNNGSEITTPGEPGQPACKGPATCAGYYDDDEGNHELSTDDGWMLMGDLCTIDADGYLRVIGRTSDIIIRGGKNISAVQVEDHVATHPSVRLAAAVAMPDAVFGERVCVFVELAPGETLSLEELIAHLKALGVSPEMLPERLEVRDELPRSSGAKIAKGELRSEIQAALSEAEDGPGHGSVDTDVPRRR
jgi:acyl-CoA synthetase